MKSLPRAEEWQMYAECPEEERNTCLLYEVGRESQDAKDHCAKLRNELSVDPSFDQYRKVLCYQHGVYMEPLAPFMLYPEWPEHAYLTINKVERQRRIKILEDPEQQELGIIRPVSVGGVTEKTAGQWIAAIDRQYRLIGWPLLAIGPTVWETNFRIDWNRSDREILAAIRLWLARYRPAETVQRTHAPTGGRAMSRQLVSYLKTIGALRLLRIYTWKEIPEEAGLYVDQARWVEARTKAQKLIESFPYTRLF